MHSGTIRNVARHVPKTLTNRRSVRFSPRWCDLISWAQRLLLPRRFCVGKDRVTIAVNVVVAAVVRDGTAHAVLIRQPHH